jgi:hypothetical protein
MAEILVNKIQEEKDDLAIQDAEIKRNLEFAVPHRLEKQWRLYEGRGLLSGTEDKKTAGKFNPDYLPCIYPKRIDPTKPWDYTVADQLVNVERCNHVLPTSVTVGGAKIPLRGKELQAYAEIHCEEHLDWYFETHARVNKKTGEKRPPSNTQINVPKWVETVGEDPNISDRERRVARMKTRMKSKEATKEEVSDAVNEHYGTKRGKTRKEE